MNTRRKGRQLEIRAKTILEAEGWLVEQANPKLQFITRPSGGPRKVISKAHDLWHCWDLCAVQTDKIKFIQVSVWEKASKKIKQVKSFPWVGEQEIWLWTKEGKSSYFRVLKRKNGWEWAGDTKAKGLPSDTKCEKVYGYFTTDPKPRAGGIQRKKTLKLS